MDAPPPTPPPRRRDGDVILGMLAHGIPLTLLPDLVWPCAIEHDVTGPAGRDRRGGDASPSAPAE